MNKKKNTKHLISTPDPDLVTNLSVGQWESFCFSLFPRFTTRSLLHWIPWLPVLFLTLGCRGFIDRDQYEKKKAQNLSGHPGQSENSAHSASQVTAPQDDTSLNFHLSVVGPGHPSALPYLVREGSALLVRVTLSEACFTECSFPYTLVGSQSEDPASHWRRPSQELILNPGQTTAHILLEPIDDQKYHPETFWTLDLKSKATGKVQSLSLQLEDNDPIPKDNSLPGTAELENAKLHFNPSVCSGSYTFLTSSKNEPNGEYRVTVDESLRFCHFEIGVKGAGGGSGRTNASGGNGGFNHLLFVPNQTGVLRIVVGEAGPPAPGDDSSPGGGASSVIFDPSTDPSESDLFGLSIAGGGGGTGTSRGGHGGGNFAGGDGTGDGKGAPGNGLGGDSIDHKGGVCTGYCQGGPGGGTRDQTNNIDYEGGFGKGPGRGGGRSTFGGAGGGGYGGGGAGRWASGGGGGAGKVFVALPPSQTVDLTEGTGLGQGGVGGLYGTRLAQDGSVLITIKEPTP